MPTRFQNSTKYAQLFLTQANRIHGDKFDYSEVMYKNSMTKVSIRCNTCNQLFLQTPNSHISKRAPCGCPYCRYSCRNQTKPRTTLNTSVFVQKAIEIHGDKYDYSSVFYVNSRSKVTIICRDHGSFEQTPNNHLSKGQGCPKCEYVNKRLRAKAKQTTCHQFILRAKELYGNVYDYTNTKFIGHTTPVVIECAKHGPFTVARAEKHLIGQGCPSCSQHGSQAELIIAHMLDAMNISYEREKKFEDCRSPITNRKLKFDFYIPDRRLLIEYDGEQHRKKNPLFHSGDRFERMLEHDQYKTQYATANGYHLIRITSLKDIREYVTIQFQ